MIVYRDQRRCISVRQAIENLRPSRRHADIREHLIDFGVLESALADAGVDASVLVSLRDAAVAFGRNFCRSLRGLERQEFPRIDGSGLPDRVEITVPEGYAYYGLFPESYASAAEEFYREVRPAECLVIGIRSIGTSLSAAVAGTIAELGGRVGSTTVRPFGHPFDRQVRLDPRGWPRDAYFLIVDEGPGLSGSSFGATAQALAGLGVPDARIVFFPSWNPDAAALLSPLARDHWTRHPRCVPAETPMFQNWADLSAGKWRDLFYANAAARPAIHPQHERRKYLREGILAKFAGFGARGRDAFDRARRLHNAGFSPRPIDLADGFLFTEFVPGRPAAPPQHVAAKYLAFIRREFPAPDPIPWRDLMTLIRVNTAETLGLEWAGRAEALAAFQSEVETQSATYLDGRMLAHEWIETRSGFLKADAVDHFDDHFFPGPQDIAWDVAAAQIELDLDPRLYANASGDREIHRRMPFYVAAYSAFRLGYCRFFEHADPNFRREAARYESALARCLFAVSSSHVDRGVLGEKRCNTASSSCNAPMPQAIRPKIPRLSRSSPTALFAMCSSSSVTSLRRCAGKKPCRRTTIS